MDTASSKSRLLLVDGDPKSLRVLDVSLKKAGFDVTTATSGREALALLEISLPDLIISDTDLDEMDGFALCRQIKARTEWNKIPFLFVSGRKSIEDKIRGLELGVEDYLSKPIYIKEIAIRVRTALQRAERERMESRREGRTRFAGDLSDVGVVDLVQTIEVNRKSGIIHIVNRDDRRGSIFFRDGKVIDAEVGRLSGANALYRLFSWSEGRFAVEFKQIRRHDVIDTPMAPLLMEGMRRLDETTRLLDRLPPARSVLEVDCRVLAEELAELPDEMNSVLRLCDGTRTLQEVVEDSDHPDLEALTIISRLFAAQIVFPRDAPAGRGESEPGERLARWLAEGGAEDGIAAEDASASSDFLAQTELAGDSDVLPLGSLSPTATLKLPAVTAEGGSGRSARPVSGPARAAAVATSPGDRSLLAGAKLNTAELSAEETLGAALPPRATEAADDGEARTGSSRAGDTLKGVPVETLLGEEAPTRAIEPPPDEAGSPHPSRPMGLAERMLSDDSAVRESAMHEAISDGGGTVTTRLPTDRNTREYGAPEESAALVEAVVSNAREPKREPPADPERPSKEVDWGEWPAGASVAPAGASGPEPPAPLPTSSNQAEPPAPRPATPSDPEPPEVAVLRVGALLSPPEAPADAADPDEALPTPVGSREGEAPLASALPPQGEAPAPSVEPVASQPSPAEVAEVRADAAFADSEIAAASIGTSYRQLWFFAIGAFVVGAVGFLVLFGKGSDPEAPQAPLLAADSPPGQAVQPGVLDASAGPEPAGLAGKPAPAPAAKAAKPAEVPKAASPAAAAPPPAQPNAAVGATRSPDELRRECLGVDAGGKGRAKAVTNACRPALKANPDDVDVMLVLARAELDRGRSAEAGSLAKKALAIDANRADAYVYLGNAEQEAGRIDDARAAYKKYLELAPNGPFAQELRAILDNR
jgi:CheY-like chemotaxis protein